MKCALGCWEAKSPAIGIANLSTSKDKGIYALCEWHYSEIQNGNWSNVNLDGWESLLPAIEEKKVSDV